MIKFRIVFFPLIILLFSACGHFLEKMGNPKADFLYFDVENSVIHCDKKDGGISLIDVFFYDDSLKKRIPVITDKRFDPKGNMLDISKELKAIDPSVHLKHDLYVQIWDFSPVIYDYGIYLQPNDWTKKKIQGTWNAR